MSRFSERWNQKAATRFADAQRAGVAQDVDSFLQEFYSLHRFEPHQLAQLHLSEAARRLMTDEGLPVDAAPFLSLQAPANLLRPVIELWPCSDDHRNARLANCFSLYSDGSGNPICIDTSRQGSLIWFDHETELAHECYVNASVVELAEFMLLRMVDPNHQPPLSMYADVDPKAVLPATFWHTAMIPTGAL
jgi:hypothetical protein